MMLIIMILLLLAPVNTILLAQPTNPTSKPQEEQPFLVNQQPDNLQPVVQQTVIGIDVADEAQQQHHGQLDRQQQVNWVITRFLGFVGTMVLISYGITLVLEATHST